MKFNLVLSQKQFWYRSPVLLVLLSTPETDNLGKLCLKPSSWKKNPLCVHLKDIIMYTEVIFSPALGM